MDTNATARAFVTVDNEVIGLRPYADGVALEFVDVLVARRRKGMMVGDPATLLLVPEERWKIHHPGNFELQGGRIVQLQNRRQVRAQTAERLSNRVLRVGDQQYEVARFA